MNNPLALKIKQMRREYYIEVFKKKRKKEVNNTKYKCKCKYK